MRVVRVISVVVAGLMLVSAAVWAGLPIMVERTVLPSILSRIGIEHMQVGVRRIGVFGVDLGPVAMMDGPSVASVHVDYTPIGLLHGRISGIRCAGLVVPVSLSGGTVSVPGIFPFRKEMVSSADVGNGAGLPAFPLDRLEVAGAAVILTGGTKEMRIPFEAKVSRTASDGAVFRASGTAWPRGQKLRMDADLDMPAGSLSCTLELPDLNPAGFTDFFPPDAPMIRGRLFVRGRVDVDLGAPHHAAVSVSARTDRVEVLHGDTVAIVEPDNGPALELRIKGQRGTWDAVLSGLRLRVGPHQTGLGPVQAQVQLLESGVNGSMHGQGSVRYFGSRNPLDIVPEAAITLPVGFSGSWEGGTWNIQGRSEERETGASRSWKVALPGSTLTMQPPAVEFKAGDDGSGVEVSGTVRGAGIVLRTGKNRVRMERLQGVGSMRRQQGRQDADVSLEVSAGQTTVVAEDLSMTLPGMVLRTSGSVNGTSPGLRSTFELSRGRLVHAGSGTSATGISVRIPLVWPPKRAGKGMFRIGALARGKLALGSVRGSIRQTGLGMEFDGAYMSTLLPGARLAFSGEAQAGPKGMTGGAKFSLADYRVPDSYTPGKLFPSLKGFRLGGTLEMAGEAQLDMGRMQASARLGVTEGVVRSDDLDLKVTGINGTVVFPDLPAVRSAPAQTLAFARCRLGEVELSDARAVVQVESPESLFLEQARFSWCGGRVFVQPFRVVPGRDTYDLVLFCDRVRLAPLLQQLGGLRARGEGAVSGRIPLAINGKTVRFDDGFLYSSPGEGGRVELTGTEIFTAGIPPETMQYAQLDLAREALKEYDYDWVKLGFHSEEDMLLMRLQFDGKPAGPLPFVYDRTFGGFARVKAGHKGSNFQGIRLDVNFRLPLDTILQYGSGAGKIFEMME